MDEKLGKCEFRHVAPSIEAFLSDEAYHFVTKNTPNDRQNKEEREEANARIEEYLDQNLFTAFGQAGHPVSCSCLLHPGFRCSVFERHAEPGLVSCEVTDSVEEVSSSPPSSPSPGAVQGEPTPSKGGQETPDPSQVSDRLEHLTQWTLFEGGSPCLDESMRGLQMRFGGASTTGYLVFIALTCRMRPKLGMHEITAAGTAEIIAGNKQLIAAGYKVFTVLLDPTKAGKPLKRPRRYSAFWLEVFAEFVGTEEELLKLFARSVDINANAFFFLDEDRAEENRERAALQGSYYDNDEACATLPLQEMFKAKTCEKVEAHLKLRGTHQGLNGCFVCDAEHIPARSTPGTSTSTPSTDIFICDSLFDSSLYYCRVWFISGFNFHPFHLDFPFFTFISLLCFRLHLYIFTHNEKQTIKPGECVTK